MPVFYDETQVEARVNSRVPTTRTVAGKPLSGDVALVKADVGLGNVDNTSDTAKPVSTAQQTALDGKEPSRTTVTQAEAEAGTATTVRGWTAQRVAQAIAGYIAANVASIKTTLGITAAPIRFSAATATIATTGSDRADAARTITGARMRVAGAPAGSALSVVVQHWDGTTWSTVTTLTIAAGSTAEATVTGLTQAQAAGNLVRLNVTSVGSTTAATGVVVDVVVQ